MILAIYPSTGKKHPDNMFRDRREQSWQYSPRQEGMVLTSYLWIGEEEPNSVYLNRWQDLDNVSLARWEWSWKYITRQTKRIVTIYPSTGDIDFETIFLGWWEKVQTNPTQARWILAIHTSEEGRWSWQNVKPRVGKDPDHISLKRWG
jgi:hypothetical protein